jgi:F420H(2)-dependent quinone reductase
MDIGDAFERIGLRLHQALYQGSGGRIGHRAILVPTLLLTTTGRRSGHDRVAALIYARDGRDYVVVASNHGEDGDPGWLHNIRANASVGVQVGRRTGRGHARVVGLGDPDYDRLWELVNRNNRGRYARYQARTRRPIPIVVITPATGSR